MRDQLVALVKEALKQVGVGITSYANLQYLTAHQHVPIESAVADLEFLSQLPDDQVGFILKTLLPKSKSQLRQDLFVLSEMDFKRQGYFVEFGATDGIRLSNTYLLEKEFDWDGIVAEPAKCWHAQLRKNRCCLIDTRCVWTETNRRLVFNEVAEAEFSTLVAYSASDRHREKRQEGRRYEVETVSLLDLLQQHKAPTEIDYLSIDTEGSEFEILSGFNFDRYKIKIITCEHNRTPTRQDIYSLLTSHGYVRKCETVSRFDDWYVQM